MPRIGKITLDYGSRWGTEHTVWYTQKKGFEVRDLPSEITSMTDVRTSHYATEKTLGDALYKACKEYREMIKTKERVILYKCLASTHLRMNKAGKGHYSGRLPGVSKNIHSFDGSGYPLATVGVGFKVCEVVDDGAERKNFEYDMDTEEVGQFSFRKRGHWLEMPFTEERYEFFQDIVKGMQEMVVQMSKFFGAEPEQAALLIENKTKLLTS